VANSIAIFRELSWLTRGMAKVKLDHKAAGLRSARLLSFHSHKPNSHKLGLLDDISKLHSDDYVGRAGSFRTSRDWLSL
jgi:hypothetical protein